ncbi:hypothetical protein OGAPHI_006305 [Ogataea philodendri]|uniref:Myb-like DNA-binding protein BAS1 n=1 Tax=Ogataea philodendri TaxID=1378263 RepID=A0A9P8NZ39_9ASCO|nr:uncharacterized protein OGAPHI_006305 [Ogataea philodendri]KAH3662124.1 hypothetical protein OGAPHI_006305 [Ogataea philodendri]
MTKKATTNAIDHLAVTESLGYKVFRKQTRSVWTEEKDKILREAVISQFLEHEKLESYDKQRIKPDSIDWTAIAANFDNYSAMRCRKRWVSALDPRLRRGKWTPEEDDQLLKAYQELGPVWGKVSERVEGRTEDQCSKRYIEVLNPDNTDRTKPWSLEEDLQLIKSVQEHGTRWRTVAAAIHGRPSLTCRNRWRKIMTDVARKQASRPIMVAVGAIDGSYDESGKREPAQAPPVSVTPMPVPQTTFQRQPLARPANGMIPGKSQTEWRFEMIDPKTNEPISNFNGSVQSQDQVHRIIELAKYNGVNITIHQHIHHHYSAQTSALDPTTSLNRYSHFNYLPPLTEVPKLTSNSGGSPHTETSPAATQTGGAKSTPPNTSDDEEMEDQDFWESMRSLTQPTAPTVGSKPVSRHHPLHYQDKYVTEVTEYSHGVSESRVEDDEDEEEEAEAEQYGWYYNVPRKGTGTGDGYVMPFNPS